MSERLRRHPRIPRDSPVRIAWQDATGANRYATGKCVDVSETGLRIKVQEEIPVRTIVVVQAESLRISGTAFVKNVRRHGFHHLIGLELAQKVSITPGASEAAVVN